MLPTTRTLFRIQYGKKQNDNLYHDFFCDITHAKIRRIAPNMISDKEQQTKNALHHAETGVEIPRKITCLIFAILVVAATMISIVAISTRTADLNKLANAHMLSTIDSRLESAFATINAFPGSAGKDLLFLKTLTRAEDFHAFIGGNDAYRALFLFDGSGICIMKIERGRSGGGLCEAPPVDVMHALERAEMLDADVVHISPLILYEGAPALLYVTARTEGGMIISVIDADYFLEEIRRLTRKGESVYLLARNGGYLAHPDHAQEALVGGGANFYGDFESVPAGALDDTDMRRFETKSHIFTFWRIFPSASNFALHEGASGLYGKEHADEDYWIMAAVSEKFRVGEWWQESSYLIAVSLIVLLNLFLIVFAYMIVRQKPHYHE